MEQNKEDYQNLIKELIRESIVTKERLIESCIPNIEASSHLIIHALENNHKVLVCGNGGSASDSQHFAAELIVRYEKERKGLPAIALTTDSSILTACSNDYSFEHVFSRQIEALGNPGDIFVAISTSGNSPNIIAAVKSAKEKGMVVIGLLGKDGGKMRSLPMDATVIVPSTVTSHIQESHITIIHIWCRLIDEAFVPKTN